MNAGDVSLWDGQSSVLYAEYCKKHDTYSVTSTHLVELVSQYVQMPSRVVDLACGTGATSLAIRAQFGDNVVITGIDCAEDMLNIARSDSRLGAVSFIHAKAELFSDHVEPYVDAILCNSAFWLMNMPAVLRHAASLLKPGGVFSFSCPGYLLRDAVDQAHLGKMPALMLSFAEMTNVEPSSPMEWAGLNNYALSEAAVERMANAAGFTVAERQSLVTWEANQATYDAMKIPAILARYLPLITSEKRSHVLRLIFERLEPEEENMVEWYSYILSKN
jgi:ubiquinone/menaquinone biosynthesis C-methylase UbiE